ncbi:hypothetical protein H8958_012560 [Nasalis larvatus]
MMSDDIDWLRSHRGVCKVDLYNPAGQQDQDRKVICFVDVSNLNVEDKDYKDAAGSSSEGNLNLGNLEEKEIIVIKDTEKTSCNLRFHHFYSQSSMMSLQTLDQTW